MSVCVVRVSLFGTVVWWVFGAVPMCVFIIVLVDDVREKGTKCERTLLGGLCADLERRNKRGWGGSSGFRNALRPVMLAMICRSIVTSWGAAVTW